MRKFYLLTKLRFFSNLPFALSPSVHGSREVTGQEASESPQMSTARDSGQGNMREPTGGVESLVYKLSQAALLRGLRTTFSFSG